MEPANVNSPTPEDQQIAAWLRKDAAPLADDGFSLRVLAELPAPRTRSSLRRWIWPTAGAVAGLAVVVALGGNVDALTNLNREALATGASLTTDTIAVSAILLIAALAALVWDEAV